MNRESTFEKVYMKFHQGGYYSTKELSDEFRVSQKSIQNYVKELRENSGLEKEGTKYYLPNAFRNIEITQRVEMSTALMIALYKEAIPQLENSILHNFQTLPKKLDAFIFNIHFETIENEALFNQLVNAIIQKVSISFEYKNKEHQKSTKTIYPLKVANMQECWYLIGYDLKSEKIKSYYIKYLSHLVILEESYLSVKKEQTLSSLTINSIWYKEHQQSVILKATEEAYIYLKRKNNPLLQIIKESNDAIFVEMSYYNDIEVLTFVQRWLPYICIENNQVLQEKLQKRLMAFLEKTK